MKTRASSWQEVPTLDVNGCAEIRITVLFDDPWKIKIVANDKPGDVTPYSLVHLKLADGVESLDFRVRRAPSSPSGLYDDVHATIRPYEYDTKIPPDPLTHFFTQQVIADEEYKGTRLPPCVDRPPTEFHRGVWFGSYGEEVVIRGPFVSVHTCQNDPR